MTKEEKLKLGENIKFCRESKNFTQEELAYYLCCTRECIAMWETGKRSPNIIYSLKLCKILNIDLQDITYNLVV